MAQILHSMGVATVLLVLYGVRESNQVPASQTEKFWEEIANVKIMMASIADALDKFNTHYLTQLDAKMLATSSLLGHIDSNVRNLQERAHVWDTFQLHVAAWNEQISMLDRKVDILSRGHEKIALLDGKVSALATLDYKVERLVRKMDDADSKLAVIVKTLGSQREDPLFGEFATRGILSTLKVIERKVDHIEAKTSARAWPKGSPSEDRSALEGGDEAALGRGKLVIKCNTPAAVEELLRDVASKVDVIFDKVGQERDDEDVEANTEGFMADELMEQPGKENVETKLLERLWRRLTAPNKKTTRALEAIDKGVRAVETSTTAMRSEHTALLNAVLDSCQKSAQDTARIQSALQTVESSTTAMRSEHTTLLNAALDSCQKSAQDTARIQSALQAIEVAVEPRRGGDALAEHFARQRTDIAALFEQAGRCGNDSKSAKLEVEDAEERVSVLPRLPAWVANACEDLGGTDSLSGEYSFGESDVNAGGRDFSRRYCQMGGDRAGWTVIQRRGEFPGGRQNFSLPWEQYKLGFGDLRKEFWFGNDFIHRLTTEKAVMLRVELEGFDGGRAWAQYSNFSVANEAGLYRVHVGGYTGNATDSLSAHDGVPFSTADRGHDAAPACCPCAPAYGGGWWFDSCFESNLNGAYFLPTEERADFRGIIWEHWRGNSSLRATRMMVRPRAGPYPGDVANATTARPNEDGDTEAPEDP